jgi:peptide/nickel transport system substrate-binding protein
MKEESRVTFPKTETGILRIPLTTIDNDMDPHSGGLVAHGHALAAIYETLTVVGPGGRVIPWLASSFQVEDGGKRYRFRLRDGVRFHDGRRLTSRDVRYSFERLLTNRESIFQSMLSCIRGANRLIEQSYGELDGFRVLSTLDFTVELDQPLSYFPVLLSGTTIAILPEGADPNRDGKHIGTGPFRMAELVPTKSMKVDANHDYWRPGFPRVESIEFIFGQTPEEVMSQFQSGRLGIAWYLPRPKMELLLQDRQHPVQHFEIPGLSTFYLAFNKKSGIFSDVSLRQRIFQSLNVEKLVHTTMGRFAVPARTFIPPALLNYEPEDTSLPSGSLERIVSDDQEITVGLSPSAYSSYREIVDEIKKFFETKGLFPKFKMILPSDISEFGRCDCGIAGWTADYPDPNTYAESNVHSRYGVAGHLIGTPEMDRLIEQGKSETDPVVRQGIYRQFEQMLRNQALLLPLFHDQINCFARPEVEGVELYYMHPFIHWENLRLR